jgi:hypothetical protein
MTFDEWFVKYPLPAEIDTMDDTDREQWTWALRSAYKTGAASTREWVGLTDEEILSDDTLRYYYGMNGGAGPVSQKGKKVVAAIEAKLKEKNT